MSISYTVTGTLGAGFVIEVLATGFGVRVYSEDPLRFPEGTVPVDGVTLSQALAGKAIHIGDETRFDWLDFQARNEVQDYSCVVFPLHFEGIQAPYNRFIDTYLSKRSGQDEFQRTRVHTAFSPVCSRKGMRLHRLCPACLHRLGLSADCQCGRSGQGRGCGPGLGDAGAGAVRPRRDHAGGLCRHSGGGHQFGRHHQGIGVQHGVPGGGQTATCPSAGSI